MGVLSPRGRMSHPQRESFPHGGDQYTPPKGSLSPHGGDLPTPPGGVVQKHLHIRAASRSGKRSYSPRGSPPPPSDINILRTVGNHHTPPWKKLSYSSPGKSFSTRGDHLIHSPPGDGVSPHRGRSLHSPFTGCVLQRTPITTEYCCVPRDIPGPPLSKEGHRLVADGQHLRFEGLIPTQDKASLAYNTTEPSHSQEVGTFHPQGVGTTSPKGVLSLTVNHKPLNPNRKSLNGKTLNP